MANSGNFLPERKETLIFTTDQIEYNHYLHMYVARMEKAYTQNPILSETDSNQTVTIPFAAVLPSLITAFVAGQGAPMTSQGLADVQKVSISDGTTEWEVKAADGSGVIATHDTEEKAQAVALELNKHNKCESCETFTQIVG